MPDMLVKLYDLENDWRFISEQTRLGITIRKPIGPEKPALIDWVKAHFSEAWAGEADIAMSNTPISCFIAVVNRQLIGFACYDATALGFFGPIGIDAAHRSRKTGSALLLACMLDMKLKGYGYAIVGHTRMLPFFQKCVGAVEIEGSYPGVFKTWVKRSKES